MGFLLCDRQTTDSDFADLSCHRERSVCFAFFVDTVYQRAVFKFGATSLRSSIAAINTVGNC